MKRFYLFLAICLTTVFATKTRAQEVYTSFVQSTGTLTYYYDDQRAARETAGETVEVYDPDATRFVEYHAKVKKAVIDASMQNAASWNR